MKSIVRLKLNYFKEVEIQESIEVIDHKNHYNINFPNYYNPKFQDVDYYVSKDLYKSIPHKRIIDTYVTLYVTGIKYYKNPEYYLNLIKNYKI